MAFWEWAIIIVLAMLFVLVIGTMILVGMQWNATIKERRAMLNKMNKDL